MALSQLGLRTHIEDVFSKLQSSDLYKRASDNPIVASASAVVASIVLFFLRKDYKTFKSYGPSGIPSNIIGWIASTFVLRLISRERLSTKVYDDPGYLDCDEESFLETHAHDSSFPPQRKGSRPTISPHPVPQRQTNQLPLDSVKKQFETEFWKVMKEAEAKGAVQISKGGLEKQGNAVFVSEERKRYGSNMAMGMHTAGEFCHLHPEGSLHLILDRGDCKKIIEAGWGERHALSGVKMLKKLAGFYLPITYIMIYAPRDKDEIDTVLEIVKGSIAFMTGPREKPEV